MPSSIVTCLLVAALILAIGGQEVAGLIVVGACAVWEFARPAIAGPAQVYDLHAEDELE